MHKRGREEGGDNDGSSSGEDVDPATEYVSLTEELRRVAALYATEVTAPRRACAEDKALLLEYMDAQGIEYAKVPPGVAAVAGAVSGPSVSAASAARPVYVKVSTVTTGGRSLCVGTFVDVVKELRTMPAVLAAALAAVDEELEAGKVKWARDHKDDGEEKDAEELPVTPQARITSRGCAQRAVPPLGRPLTTAEQLAEVLYAAVHRVHKPRKRRLEISKSAKRGAVAVPLAGDMAERAAGCYVKETAVKARAKEYAAVRAKCRQALAACEDALGAHMAETHEDIVETPADGGASVVLSLETKPEKAKPLTLPEFSAMLDGIVAALPLTEGASMADLLREFGDVIVDAIIVAMEARLAARALETVVVVKKPGGGRSGKLAVDDAFEGSDDEDDDEDNMYGV